jgi:hypothetical protein
MMTAIDYADRAAHAFAVLPLSSEEARWLSAALDNPGANAEELSAKLGWGGKSFNLHFEKIVSRRASVLWKPPIPRTGGMWVGSVFLDSTVREDGKFGLFARPELFDVLRNAIANATVPTPAAPVRKARRGAGSY